MTRELLSDLLALLWPCACMVCGAPNRQLCASCRRRLRTTVGTAQLVRSSSRGEMWVYGSYVGALRALLIAYKHGGAVWLAAPLGELLSGPVRCALEARRTRAPALIVTAPSRVARVRARGYRHVDLLVRRALRCLSARGEPGAYLVAGGLRALPGRTGQVGLRAGQRARNAALVQVPRRMRGRLRGREVVLVDDIVTTGATLDAAEAALAGAGATVIATVTLGVALRRDARGGTAGRQPERAPKRVEQTGDPSGSEPVNSDRVRERRKVRPLMWPPASTQGRSPWM